MADQYGIGGWILRLYNLIKFIPPDSVFIGVNCGIVITNPRYAVALGYGALQNITTGTQNTAVGFNAGNALTTPEGNTFFGYYAGASITTGFHNVALGKDCLRTATVVEHCTAVGEGSLYNCIGNNNVGVGSNTGRLLEGGAGNTFIGASAGWNVVEDNNNVAVGYCALRLQVGWVGGCNTAIGSLALEQGINTAFNIGLGFCAGQFETTSNKLFIDNTPRINEADQRIKAIIYGIMDGASANQRLRINGRVGITHLPNYANDAAAGVGGLISGELYSVTGSDPLQVAAKI